MLLHADHPNLRNFLILSKQIKRLIQRRMKLLQLNYYSLALATPGIEHSKDNDEWKDKIVDYMYYQTSNFALDHVAIKTHELLQLLNLLGIVLYSTEELTSHDSRLTPPQITAVLLPLHFIAIEPQYKFKFEGNQKWGRPKKKNKLPGE